MPKGHWTDGDYWGWIPNKIGVGGRYMRFVNDTEYREVYEASRILNRPLYGN